MSFNLYALIVPLYTLFAFFIQRPKTNRYLSLIVVVGILLVTRLNPIYRDALQPLLFFILFFLTSYLQHRDVSYSILLSAIPLVWLHGANLIMFQLQLPSIWATIFVTLALISLLTWTGQQALVLSKQQPTVQRFLYIIALLLYFACYYHQLTALFAYFFVSNGIWFMLFRALFAAFVLVWTMVMVFFHQSNEQIRAAEQAKARNTINQQYVQVMTQQYDEMRQFRHDYENMLLSLDGLIQAEKWQDLKDYSTRELSKHHQHTNEINHQLSKLIYVQNADLRNLIYSKLAYASSLQLTLHLEIKTPILLQTRFPLELARMLGILLDNAIEAAAEIPNGELTVAFIDESSEVMVIVSNSCKASIKPVSRLKVAGYSTKGADRGLGLYNLDQLVGETNLLLNTEVKQQVFTQELIIPQEGD